TTAGLIYWSKTAGDLTEFFDQSFRPLGWYCLQVNGKIYFARARAGKNKFVFYDANMRQIKPPKQDSFWEVFFKGLAVLPPSAPTSMQQASAYQRANSRYQPVAPYSYNASTISQPGLGTTNTYDSLGNSYVTNSQQIGNMTFSNTFGSNGYTANSTTQ